MHTFQDTFEDDSNDCNEHVKGAMQKVLLLIKDTIPKILDEKTRIDYESRVQMMGACVLLFVYCYADMKNLDGWEKSGGVSGGFKHLLLDLEEAIADEKINEIVQMMVEGDDAFRCGSLRRKPYEILVELGPHPGHKLSSFTSSGGMVFSPFQLSVKDLIACSLDVCREKDASWKVKFPAKEMEEDARRGHPLSTVAIVGAGKSGVLLDEDSSLARSHLSALLNASLAANGDTIKVRVDLKEAARAYKVRHAALQQDSDEEGSLSGKRKRDSVEKNPSDEDEQDDGGKKDKEKKKKKKKPASLVGSTGSRFSTDAEESAKAYAAVLAVIRAAEPDNALFSEDKQTQIISLAQKLYTLVQTDEEFRNVHKVDAKDITASTLVHAAAHWNKAREKGEDRVLFFSSLPQHCLVKYRFSTMTYSNTSSQDLDKPWEKHLTSRASFRKLVEVKTTSRCSFLSILIRTGAVWLGSSAVWLAS